MNVQQERGEQRPLGGLLTDLASQVDALLRTEFNLFRAEMNANVQTFKGGLVALLVGAVLLIAGLMALVQAVIAALVDSGMEVWLASTMVGGVLTVIGVIAFKMGADKMSPADVMPSRTARQVEKDASLIKETVR